MNRLRVPRAAFVLFPAALFVCASAAEAAPGAYAVQVGAFRSKANARAFCAGFAAKGYPFKVQEAPGTSGAPLFRCRSAASPSHDKAEALAQRFRSAEGQAAIVVAVAAAAPASARVVPRTPPSKKHGESAAPPQEAVHISPELQRSFQQFFKQLAAERKQPAAAAKPEEKPLDVASLGGTWCSDLALYRGLPPLSWQVTSPHTVKFTFPILAGSSRGQLQSIEQKVEILPGRRVKLEDDTQTAHTETIYRLVDGRQLNGLTYRRTDKQTGETTTMKPDSFRRCDGAQASRD
jgi:hypothetical protein